MNLPEFLTRDTDGEIRLTGHRIGLYTVARLTLRSIIASWSFTSLSTDSTSVPIRQSHRNPLTSTIST